MKKRKRRYNDECTIPPPLDVTALPDLVFGQPEHEAERVRAYMEWQCKDEAVTHLEKVGSEALMGRKMGLWDVTTDKGKWWVITNPTNLYSQKLFPSLDYTISFHVGVTTRMFAAERNSEGNVRGRGLLPTLKKLETAGHALDNADEVEEFQSVGMKLRECLLTLVLTLAKPEYVPADHEAPKRGDFIHWMELVADAVASGPQARETRAYLKSTAKTTWQLVNWLTHTSNAVAHDAQLAQGATENVVGAFVRAVEKHESAAPDRCPDCGSYRIVSDYRPDLGIDPPYILLCERCDWISPKRVRAEAARAANDAARTTALVRQGPKGGRSIHESRSTRGPRRRGTLR